MKKQLQLFSFFCIVTFFSSTTLGQVRVQDGLNSKRNGLQQKELIKQNKESKQLISKMKNELVYSDYLGNGYPVSNEHLWVKFKNNVSLSTKIEILNEFMMFDNISKDALQSPSGIPLSGLDLRAGLNPMDLIKLKDELNSNPNVKYVSYFYKVSDESSIAPQEDVVVKLKSGDDFVALNQAVSMLGGKMLKSPLSYKNIYYVEADEASNYNSVLFSEKLLKEVKVEYAQPNLVMSNAFRNTNDPLVNNSWGLNNDGSNVPIGSAINDVDMNVFEAWGLSTGASSVRVAVVDDGIDFNHPDLDDVTIPGLTLNGFGPGQGLPEAGSTHGTACAGIIGAEGDNEIGSAGVAHGVTLIPMNASAGGDFISLAAAAEGIMRAVDEFDAALINCSFGTQVGFQPFIDAVNNASTNGRGGLGSMIFWAMGNGNSSTDRLTDTPAVVGVGGFSPCGERKNPSDCSGEDWGSDFGPAIDISAPAVHWTTPRAGTSEYLDRFNGTSSATPATLGVVGLILSLNPGLPASEVEEILMTTARRIGDNGYENTAGRPFGTYSETVGYGMPDAFAALSSASPGPIVSIGASSLSFENVEAIGCEVSRDYEFRVRIGEYTGTDDPVVTVNVVGGTATLGDDFELPNGNTITLTGNNPQTGSIIVRTISDGIMDAGETIEFEIELDAGNTDAVLSDNEDLTSTTWTILDATTPEETAAVNFTSNAVEPEQDSCFDGDLTFELNLDNWPNETSWEFVDVTNNVVIDSDGPYNNPADDFTTITRTFNGLPDGEYRLSVFDSFGDGLTTGFTLTTSTGQTIADVTGDFDNESTTVFCLEAGSAVNAYLGILPVDGTIQEVEECAQEKNTYDIAINISDCVEAEQDVTATIVVDAASTATEGVDFVFPNGKSVTFSGEMEETLLVPIDFLADGEMEGNETIVLSIVLSNDELADLGEVAMQTITILDIDVPQLQLSTTRTSVNESDYNCEGEDNSFSVFVSMTDVCDSFTGNVDVMIGAHPDSEAVEGEDFEFADGNTYTISADQLTDPLEIVINVFNDNITEGEEQLILQLSLTDEESASLANTVSLLIKDPRGNLPPELTVVVTEDFEGGNTLPDGWSFIGNNDTHSFIVSDATDMDGNAAHVTDGNGYAYDGETGFDGYLLSPEFTLDPILGGADFRFQVNGEFFLFFGIQIITDFAEFGMVPASVDATDFATVDDEFVTPFGRVLDFLEPVFLSDFVDFNLAEAFGEDFDGQNVRLAFRWAHDGTVTENPPLAIDDIVIGQSSIETNTMSVDMHPNYPINSGLETYFYNTSNGKIAMSVNASTDHGCSTGYVSDSGTSATKFISDELSAFRSDKAFTVEAGQADTEASVATTLYYTEEEVAGWESFTGQSRENALMFKTEGVLSNLCYTETVVLSITLDNFPEETTWSVEDANGTVVASDGPYDDQPDGATVTETLSLPAGTYTFTINDEFGDGICCGFGDGSYSLTDLNGTEIVSGGAFGDSESTTFCTDRGVTPIVLCQDYRNIEMVPVTFVPFQNGFKVTGTFETGLYDITTFGLAGEPSFAPGEFTAVQNGEQVDITFENKYGDESNVAYYIFEKDYAGAQNTEELEIVEADGSGTYSVTDFFPHAGLNVYTVTYVLTDGSRVTPCYEASVLFELTNEFKVFPNPASDEITILISDDKIKGASDISIYDETGRMVASQAITTTRGVLRYTMDISALSTGMYFVIVDSEEGKSTASFVKVR